jgi:hypothetical protein
VATSKPAIQVTTDSGPAKRDNSALNQPEVAKPANEVTTDSDLTEHFSAATSNASKARILSSCEPYRDFIELGLQRGRNAVAIGAGKGAYGVTTSYSAPAEMNF